MPTYYPPGTRKRNRFYIVRGSIDGQEHEITTDTGDKRHARAAWKAFAEAVRKKRERDRARPRALETFADVADAYLAAETRSKDQRRYVKRLKKDALGALLIAEVKHSDVTGAANRLYPGAKPQTKNRNAIAPAAAILHFAARDGLRDYLRIERFKEPEPETRRPRVGVAGILLDNTEGPKHLLLAFLFHQGWRITETLSLRWENVRLPQRVLRVYIGKSGKWKDIPMADEVFEALAPHARDDGFVFPWRDRHAVYRWLRPLCKTLNIAFTPHMARHDFGGQLREEGATARDLVDVGTWTSEKSTSRYQHAGSDHARNVLRRRNLGAAHGENDENRNESTG